MIISSADDLYLFIPVVITDLISKFRGARKVKLQVVLSQLVFIQACQNIVCLLHTAFHEF